MSEDGDNTNDQRNKVGMPEFGVENKITICNLETGESMECQYNPETINVSTKVNYNNLKVPGMSYEVVQYSGTGNRQISGLKFELDEILNFNDAGNMDKAIIPEFRNFLLSLTVPSRKGRGKHYVSSPPLVALYWAAEAPIRGFIKKVDYEYSRFFPWGEPSKMSVTIDIEEFSASRRYGEDRRKGS